MVTIMLPLPLERNACLSILLARVSEKIPAISSGVPGIMIEEVVE
jgi:hypothetical protein